MKLEHETKLVRCEMSTVRWTCGFTLKERNIENADHTHTHDIVAYSAFQRILSRGFGVTGEIEIWPFPLFSLAVGFYNSLYCCINHNTCVNVNIVTV